jgi:polyhydroxybutyrate depolymerase
MRFLVILFNLCLICLSATIAEAGAIHTQERTITVDDRERSFLIHVPRSYQTGVLGPLTLVFHDDGGHGRRFEAVTRFSEKSDASGTLVVYPNAIDGHWNDGRESEMFADHDAAIDDVHFVLTLIQALRREFPIDTTRIFAAGVSNGGMFVQRLAIEHAEIFSGIASINSSIPEPFKDKFQPSMPVSVLFINGTANPFVPYEGGEVTINLFPNVPRAKPEPSRGRVLSTDESINMWRKRNKIGSLSVSAHVPDNEPRDKAVARLKTYADGERGTYVSLYRVIGGGHTVPGGSKFIAPKDVFGNTCTDFDATEAIWGFFEQMGRK